jgi:CMP/dCMP kinase
LLHRGSDKTIAPGKFEMPQDRQVKDRHRVIAIDGPAASGKSSVAHELARRLGFVYVNSGAMYRAVTWHVLNHGIDPDDDARIAQFVEASWIEGELKNGELRILIEDVDPTKHLREDRVNKAVSRVSTVPEVRKILVDNMRSYARTHDLVMEGRDIGSVVFPDTLYKFYIDASPEVRAQRRAAQGHRDEIATRDQADSSRVASPLVVAKDAEVIDTSNLTIAAVVNEIIAKLKAKGLERI